MRLAPTFLNDQTQGGVLLSTAYFAPVQYYSKLLQSGYVIIERHENYNKQSYRNRCTIFSANGLLDLVVPVVKSGQPKIPVTEVEISYDTLWQKQHFKAIESAYRRSPFYEFYIDDLTAFFDRRHRYLYELNMFIMRRICELMNLPFHVLESPHYIQPGEGITDFRNTIHPKMSRQDADPTFAPPHYTQVFAGKWGFKPNLSILDLLFHAWTEAKELLALSCR